MKRMRRRWGRAQSGFDGGTVDRGEGRTQRAIGREWRALELLLALLPALVALAQRGLLRLLLRAERAVRGASEGGLGSEEAAPAEPCANCAGPWSQLRALEGSC